MNRFFNLAVADAATTLAGAAVAPHAKADSDPILQGMAHEASNVLPWQDTAEGFCNHFNNVIMPALQNPNGLPANADGTPAVDSDYGVKTSLTGVLVPVQMYNHPLQACVIVRDPQSLKGKILTLDDVYKHHNGIIAEYDNVDAEIADPLTITRLGEDIMDALPQSDQIKVYQSLERGLTPAAPAPGN